MCGEKIEEKIGEISNKLREKPDEKIEVGSLRDEVLKNYEENVHEAIQRALKTGVRDFFYIVIVSQKLLVNTGRMIFYTRKTIPRPNLDETVFKYTIKDEKITHLWTLPDRFSFQFALNDISELGDCCRSFQSGELGREAERIHLYDCGNIR